METAEAVLMEDVGAVADAVEAPVDVGVVVAAAIVAVVATWPLWTVALSAVHPTTTTTIAQTG